MDFENQQHSVEEQLHRLDRAVALSRVGGDTDLLREVIALFLDDYPLSLELIRTSILQGDGASLERHAHSLKGSVSTFGAQEVFDAALALEKQGRSRDLSSAAASLQDLERALDALRPELESLQFA